MNINDKIPKLLKDSGIKVGELSRRTGISVAVLNEYKCHRLLGRRVWIPYQDKP